MKDQLKYTMMTLVAWTTLIIWAVTLPSLTVLVLALVCKSLVWMGVTGDLLITLSNIGIPQPWSTMLLLLNLSSLFMFVRSITAIAHGPIMRFLVGTPTRICNSICQKNSEHNTNQINKPQI